MNTTTLRPQPRPRRTTAEPLRSRAELPAIWHLPNPLRPAQATHDFLVPNPRPDLTTDLRTLRMIEAG